MIVLELDGVTGVCAAHAPHGDGDLWAIGIARIDGPTVTVEMVCARGALDAAMSALPEPESSAWGSDAVLRVQSVAAVYADRLDDVWSLIICDDTGADVEVILTCAPPLPVLDRLPSSLRVPE